MEQVELFVMGGSSVRCGPLGAWRCGPSWRWFEVIGWRRGDGLGRQREEVVAGGESPGMGSSGSVLDEVMVGEPAERSCDGVVGEAEFGRQVAY
jgi:hypothetical protein